MFKLSMEDVNKNTKLKKAFKSFDQIQLMEEVGHGMKANTKLIPRLSLLHVILFRASELPW